MQIGIPRALSYYSFFPFWYGFFSDLGIEIILSDKTTKQTMSLGASLVVICKQGKDIVTFHTVASSK